MDVKNKKIKYFKKKGVTLVEVIIALGVFSIVIASSVATLASGVTTRHNLKLQQQSVEEIVTAINLISKRVRMGEIISVQTGNVAFIDVKDNNDLKTYQYFFNGLSNTLTLKVDGTTVVLANNIEGSFYVSVGEPKRLTISMKPVGGTDQKRVQTTVSTRVYE